MEELDLYLQTDAFAEYGDQWHDAVSFEWDLCMMGGSRCPFLLCWSAPSDGGMSGHRAKTAVKNEMKKISDDDVMLETVYSDGSTWCGHVSMSGADAEKLSGAEGAITSLTPVPMGMKLAPETVERMEISMEDYNEWEGSASSNAADGGAIPMMNMTNRRYFPRVNVLMCPGMVSQKDMDEMMISDSSSGDASGLDITKKMEGWLLSKTTAAGGEAVSAISESMYWASSYSGSGSGSSNDRGPYWTGVMSLAMDSDMCLQTIASRLVWTAEMYSPGSSFYMTVTLNETNIGEDPSVNRLCMMATVAGLATMPEVCAVDTEPTYETSNVNSQWIIQSGAQDERPFFDVGLDGSGQVVAVSDTGIDVNNCYFWDSKARSPTRVSSFL